MNGFYDPEGYLSPGEYDRAEAELGARWLAEDGSPPAAWLLSSRDVWYANPLYNGPEVPHPEFAEDEHYDDELLEELAFWDAHYREAELRLALEA